MGILQRFWRGWAVAALFGQRSKRPGILFTIIVGAAVAWPVLLIGIVAPKLAVQLIALVPLPEGVPTSVVRLAWIGLAVLIPLGVGTAVAVNSGRGMPFGRRAGSVLRGFPITIGLAAAFAILFVSFPLTRFVAFARRRTSGEIPLIMNATAYAEVADKICEVLNRHGFSFMSARPAWWVSAPIRLISWLGGDAFRSHIPGRLQHFATSDLAISLYPSGLVLHGRPERLTWAHGLVAEAVVRTAGLQTTDPKAQALELGLRQLWETYDRDPAARTTGGALSRELEHVTRDLRTLQVKWDDWQVLYRQILQLDRALHGERQLLDAEPPGPDQPSPPAALVSAPASPAPSTTEPTTLAS
jgi:hypothetical protein